MVPSLTFFCPACASRLTVPISMAGVRGPCPVCSSFIEAPQPPVSAAQPQAPVYQQPAPHPQAPAYQQPQPYQQHAPHPQAPAYQQPVPHPQAPPYQQPVPHPQAYQQPAPSYAPPAQQPQEAPSYLPSPELSPAAPLPSQPQPATIPPPRNPQSSGPSVVKVEPRGNRTRSSEQPEIVARPISDRQYAGQTRDEGREYRLPPAKSRITPRLLISGAALLLMVAVSGGLILFTREDPENISSPAPGAAARPITAERAPVPTPAPTVVPDSPAATAKPEAPPAAAVPPQPAVPHPGAAAMKVVEKFLAASTLDERLPLIETHTPSAALQESILAKPFPANPDVAPDFQEANPSDGTTDFYYHVDFKDESGKPSPQVLMVRATADGAPKIIVDPFLDTFGGRLEAFADQPSGQIASFQLVISAVAQTTADRNVPNHENKLRLKLMPRDNEKEITSAYFTKGSKLGQMLVTEGSGFRYGQPRTARVTLRWNQEEDPANPYLEVTDIKEFRWNP